MSDNTVLNTGLGGDTIATDDIGGIKHQRVKIEFGVDGSATDVSSSDPLPTVVSGAALTALQLIDNLPNTLGSTTSGQSGALALGAVTTSAPSYTNAQTNALSLDTAGALRVAITSGTVGTSATDDAPFSVGSGTGTPIMGLADESGPDYVDEGDIGVVRMTLGRALHVSLRDAAGDSCMDETNNSVKVSLVSGGPSRATTATLANVSASATNVTLQASNASRLALVINNDSEAVLYVKYGSSATTSSFTYKLPPFGSLREELYSGVVTGIWESATGAARMTELTA